MAEEDNGCGEFLNDLPVQYILTEIELSLACKLYDSLKDFRKYGKRLLQQEEVAAFKVAKKAAPGLIKRIKDEGLTEFKIFQKGITELKECYSLE